jgi:osmotically-inducible protein OsmY
VADQIRHALDQPGYKDVSVSQDRDKGVVTLTGHVAADADKTIAENIPRGLAGPQVVSDQISVLPPGNESATKDVNKDHEDIETNLAAVYIQDNFKHEVKYEVKNGVVTPYRNRLIPSPPRRRRKDRHRRAQRSASGERVEVKGQKATSTSVR